MDPALGVGRGLDVVFRQATSVEPGVAHHPLEHPVAAEVERVGGAGVNDPLDGI